MPRIDPAFKRLVKEAIKPTRHEQDAAAEKVRLATADYLETLRRIRLNHAELETYLLKQRPTVNKATEDTTVSNSTFVTVTGLSLEWRSPGDGDVAIIGTLYIEEVSAGALDVRIMVAGGRVWRPTGLVGGAKFLVPIGGPELFEATRGTFYPITVQVAAPSGSYKVLAGPESWLRTTLEPTTEIPL